MNSLLRMSENYQQDREVFAEDMLFATLEVSLRKLVFPDQLEFLLTDTVGFVGKLPHDLVDAFKATLEEVRYADLLLHVVDVSNENYQQQVSTTLKVLKELGVESKSMVTVYNKMDRAENLAEVQRNENTLFISALSRTNLDGLIEKIREEIGTKLVETDFLIPYTKGGIAAQLHEEAQVLSSDYIEEGILLKAKLPTEIFEKYRGFERK